MVITMEYLIDKLLNTEDISEILDIKKQMKSLRYMGIEEENYICENYPIDFGTLIQRFHVPDSCMIRELFHTTDREDTYDLNKILASAKSFLLIHKESIPCSLYNNLLRRFIHPHETEGMKIWKETGKSPLRDTQFFSRMYDASKLIVFKEGVLRKEILKLNEQVTFLPDVEMFDCYAEFRTDTDSVIRFLSTTLKNVENVALSAKYDRSIKATVLKIRNYSQDADFSILRGVCGIEENEDNTELKLTFYS